MPPCSRAVSRSPATRSDDADEPFRFDPSKIRSHVALEGRRRVQDITIPLIAHKDDPMPERLSPLAVPFHGKKSCRWQRRPGRKRRFPSMGGEAISFEQASDMSRLGPQSVIGGDDPQSPSRPLGGLVADAGQHGDAGNTAPRALELHDRLSSRWTRHSQLSDLKPRSERDWFHLAFIFFFHGAGRKRLRMRHAPRSGTASVSACGCSQQREDCSKFHPA